MLSNLEKMIAESKTFDVREEHFLQLRRNFLYKGVPNRDILATYQGILKAKKTFESRLNKKRMEFEILTKELNELVADYDVRCLDALTREQEEEKEAKRLEEEARLQSEQHKQAVYCRSIPNYATLPPEEQAFRRFCLARVRHRNDGYPCVTGLQIGFREIYMCYKRWADCEGIKRMETKRLEGFCEKYYGDSQGKKIYPHLRVFGDEEEIAEFENENPTIFEDDSDD